MVLNNLSLDSLRTLVITQDLGGFGRASERLGRTPSAISLQMKRLQEEVGVPLFQKQGRKTLLTEQGEIALRYARRVLELNDEMIDTLRGSSLAGVVRIGFAQDFTVNVLPLVIARFNALYPLVKLEVTVDVGQVLLQAIDSGDLDLALTLGGAQKKTAHLLSELPLHWIASPSFRDRAQQPLPLALFNPPCLCQTRGLEALDKCWTPLAGCHDEPQPDGLVGRCQCGTGTDHTSRTWPAGRRADHRPGPSATGNYTHRASSQTQPPSPERDAVRRNHRGVGRYLSSFTPEQESTWNRTLLCRSRDGW